MDLVDMVVVNGAAEFPASYFFVRLTQKRIDDLRFPKKSTFYIEHPYSAIAKDSPVKVKKHSHASERFEMKALIMWGPLSPETRSRFDLSYGPGSGSPFVEGIKLYHFSNGEGTLVRDAKNMHINLNVGEISSDNRAETFLQIYQHFDVVLQFSKAYDERIRDVSVQRIVNSFASAVPVLVEAIICQSRQDGKKI